MKVVLYYHCPYPRYGGAVSGSSRAKVYWLAAAHLDKVGWTQNAWIDPEGRECGGQAILSVLGTEDWTEHAAWAIGELNNYVARYVASRREILAYAMRWNRKKVFFFWWNDYKRRKSGDVQRLFRQLAADWDARVLPTNVAVILPDPNEEPTLITSTYKEHGSS
jgi:hypothetical protein